MRFLVCLLLLFATSCVSGQVVLDGRINQELVDAVVESIAYESGLEAKEKIRVEIKHRSDIRPDFLSAEADRSDPVHQRIEAAEISMGIRSADVSAAEAAWGITARVSRGLYRVPDRTVYFIPEPAVERSGSVHLDPWGDIGDEYVLAHEIVHALQHQHYPDLFEPPTRWARQFDARRARDAAIEGTADYFAARSLWFMGDPVHPDERDRKPPEAGPLAQEHPLMQESFHFAYEYGYRLAYNEKRALLDSPPASTEQVLHPRSDGTRQSFTAIALDALVPVFTEQGCTYLHDDTLGEFGISIWLRDVGALDTDRKLQDWDGDRWIAFACHGRVATAWLSRWDDELTAIRFEGAMRHASRSLKARGAIVSDWSISTRGREVLATTYHRLLSHPAVFDQARRARVVTLEELEAHFAQPADPPAQVP